MADLHIIVARPPGTTTEFFVQSDTMLTEFRSAAHVYLKRADAEAARLKWEMSGRGWVFGIVPVESLYG